MDQQQPYGSENVTPQGSQEQPQPDYGAPQGHYTPPYQPPPSQPPANSTYPRARGPLKMLMDPENLTKVIALGLFLMFIGAAIFTMIMASRPPDEWDEKYDSDHNGSIDLGEYDDFIKDYRGYKLMRTMGLVIGGILLELGILFLLIALLGGAILNQNIDSYSRLGMIIAASIIAAMQLFFLAQLMTLQLMGLNP